jgi:phosphinothricin acetyltransferase
MQRFFRPREPRRKAFTLIAMLIRRADPARDAAACAAIYAPFVTNSAVSFEEQAPSLAEFIERIQHYQESHAYLVAEIDGEVAGFAYAGPYRERPAYRWAAESSVYVGDRYRHRGVGKSLYTALFQVLREAGFKVVIAGVTVPNPASLALHSALGFQHVGTFPKVGYKHGAWRDVAFLSLQLGPQEDGAEPAPPSASP